MAYKCVIDGFVIYLFDAERAIPLLPASHEREYECPTLGVVSPDPEHVKNLGRSQESELEATDEF